MSRVHTRRSTRKNRSRRQRRVGGSQEYKYYVATNIVNSSSFDKIRTVLLAEFGKYRKEQFRYDDIHITMAYGPVLNANSEPELSNVLPGIEELAPSKHINDVVVKGISLFLRKDRIIIKAEIQSAGLTKLKQQLEEQYNSIGSVAKAMRDEIIKEEAELAKQYPELYTPHNPDKWAHITLLALKPDTPIPVISTILNRAGDLIKEAPTKLDCDYLYIVSKKSGKPHHLFDI